MKAILAAFAACVSLAFSQSAIPRDGCADAGSTDAYACNYTVAPGLITGHLYWFMANTANTGAATFSPNSATAKTIKKAAGGVTTDLADNDIRAGQWVALIYDGTYYQMLSLLGNAPAAGCTTVFGNTITAPVSGNWTAFGSSTGGGTRTDITFPCGGGTAIDVVGTTGAQNVYGIQVTVAGGDFSHVFVVDLISAVQNYNTATVGFTDGTKTEGCGLRNVNGLWWYTMKEATLTGSSQADANQTASPFAGNLAASSVSSAPYWIKLSRTGTALKCEISFNQGASYITAFNDVTSPYLTASALYVALDPVTSGPTVPARATLISYN